MRKTASVVILLMALLVIWTIPAMADETKEAEKTEKVAHEYVGAKKCKTCHKAQFNSWLETKHATAFNALSDKEKKKEGCVTCHQTGTTAKGVLLEGVQCEACHGPGKDYKSPKIMSKKKWPAAPEKHMKMAIEAGLNYPTEETCTRCHTKEGNPNFKPFDFDKSKPKVHVMSADSTK